MEVSFMGTNKRNARDSVVWNWTNFFLYKKKLAKSHQKLKLKIKNLKMKSFWRFSEVRGKERERERERERINIAIWFSVCSQKYKKDH
jgi:hypothetical protein